MGGKLPNGNDAIDSDVLTEDSFVCIQHAIPTLPEARILQALLFVSSTNMLLFCGGLGASAFGKYGEVRKSLVIPLFWFR